MKTTIKKFLEESFPASNIVDMFKTLSPKGMCNLKSRKDFLLLFNSYKQQDKEPSLFVKVLII